MDYMDYEKNERTNSSRFCRNLFSFINVVLVPSISIVAVAGSFFFVIV